jgi:hypothetical protein
MGGDSIKMPLSRYIKNKPFAEMTRKDIINFLDSLENQKYLIHYTSGLALTIFTWYVLSDSSRSFRI